MAKMERFQTLIKCGDCDTSGVIHESQEADGYNYMRNSGNYIDKVPDGFKATTKYYTGNERPVFCVKCESRAVFVKNL